MDAADDVDRRVLVLARASARAAFGRALAAYAFPVHACATLPALAAEIARGAAAVLTTDDALAGANVAPLIAACECQPVWADVPIIVLARRGARPPAVLELVQRAANVVVVERPVSRRRLADAIRSAVRARTRQYGVRDALARERERSAEAERASRAKDRFLAVLSHELRTPLTPIVLAVALLQREIAASSPTRRALEMISRNVTFLTRLIDDLLDLTRVAQGKLPLDLGAVDVHETIADTIAILDEDARMKDISIRAVLRADRHRVTADATRLQQVLWNLAKNAIKFTSAGGLVTLRTWNDSDALVLTCEDNGAGIPADLLPRIFEPFEQGGEGVTRAYGGLGLGLTVSRSLIDAHGGTIAAASDGPGRGSTFTIRLPHVLAEADDVQARLHPLADRHPHRRAIEILVVDDHEDTALALAESIRRLGHHVRTARTVAGALQAVATAPCDVLICDLALPDGSGFDLVRAITPRPALGAVAIAGLGMDDDIRQSQIAGFNRYLTKPIDSIQLEYVIADLLAEE